MHVLLKSGQSASREEAVEEMKDCRWMKQHWCRLTVMPEYASIDAYTIASIDAYTEASIDAHTIASIDARSVLTCEC
ncbi:hypothetical protein F2Q69_00006387 [Brassica cretica]|uniref:Uncharacterized protein n=1 Tax=Brassica cretica TaxID=69181 RepID=A0A8S9PGJ4_BRACR|nr:hypothetical protein F2Q69_00006387 [Brassica cretica]